MASLSFTSKSDLFFHLYDKIFNKEINSFSELSDHVEKIQCPFNTESIIEKSFNLLKELRWGFFKDMDKSSYLKLWKELVLRNDKYKDFGELKRNISISNIYVVLMDIHGYTKFCQQTKDNLSRLHSLDEFLSEGVKSIAKENGSIAKRERGDEILVISASATDAINTTLGIINSFSKKPVIQDESVIRDRSNYNINLPEFKISAGIAGGNFVNPLIITEEGRLSGLLLNTAARLQTRANELSPKETKVLITKSVYSNYLEENKINQHPIFKKKLIDFLDNGPIEFKNLSLSCYEILFKQEDQYKMKFQEQLSTLYQSIRDGWWKEKVFPFLLDLIKQVCYSMPVFNLKVMMRGNEEYISPSIIAALCDQAKKLYNIEEDYITAVMTLHDVLERLLFIQGFDRLVLDYTQEIYEKYASAIDTYTKIIESEIDKKVDSIFNYQHKLVYENMKKNIDVFQKLKTFAQKSKVLNKKKSIWYTLIENNIQNLEARIYSGKENNQGE